MNADNNKENHVMISFPSLTQELMKNWRLGGSCSQEAPPDEECMQSPSQHKNILATLLGEDAPVTPMKAAVVTAPLQIDAQPATPLAPSGRQSISTPQSGNRSIRESLSSRSSGVGLGLDADIEHVISLIQSTRIKTVLSVAKRIVSEEGDCELTSDEIVDLLVKRRFYLVALFQILKIPIPSNNTALWEWVDVSQKRELYKIFFMNELNIEIRQHLDDSSTTFMGQLFAGLVNSKVVKSGECLYKVLESQSDQYAVVASILATMVCAFHTMHYTLYEDCEKQEFDDSILQQIDSSNVLSWFSFLTNNRHHANTVALSVGDEISTLVGGKLTETILQHLNAFRAIIAAGRVTLEDSIILSKTLFILCDHLLFYNGEQVDAIFEGYVELIDCVREPEALNVQLNNDYVYLKRKYLMN